MRVTDLSAELPARRVRSAMLPLQRVSQAQNAHRHLPNAEIR